MSAGYQTTDNSTRPCAPHRVTLAPARYDLAGLAGGLCRSVPVKRRTQRPSTYRNLQPGLGTINIYSTKLSKTQNMHCHYDSSRAPPMHTDTLHTQHCAAMKTGLSASYGLFYQPLLPWSPQMNTKSRTLIPKM